MKWRKTIGIAIGAPSAAAAVVAIMAPIIQPSGRPARVASQPPRLPTASATKVVRSVVESRTGLSADLARLKPPSLKLGRPGPATGS